MPKLCCPCGFVHDLSPIPDDGWLAIRNKHYEAVIAAEILRHAISGGNLPSADHPRINEYRAATQTIIKSWHLVYECPECGRLMWAQNGNERFKVFTPENGGP